MNVKCSIEKKKKKNSRFFFSQEPLGSEKKIISGLHLMPNAKNEIERKNIDRGWWLKQALEQKQSFHTCLLSWIIVTGNY